MQENDQLFQGNNSALLVSFHQLGPRRSNTYTHAKEMEGGWAPCPCPLSGQIVTQPRVSPILPKRSHEQDIFRTMGGGATTNFVRRSRQTMAYVIEARCGSPVTYGDFRGDHKSQPGLARSGPVSVALCRRKISNRFNIITDRERC